DDDQRMEERRARMIWRWWGQIAPGAATGREDTQQTLAGVVGTGVVILEYNFWETVRTLVSHARGRAEGQTNGGKSNACRTIKLGGFNSGEDRGVEMNGRVRDAE